MTQSERAGERVIEIHRKEWPVPALKQMPLFVAYSSYAPSNLYDDRLKQREMSERMNE